MLGVGSAQPRLFTIQNVYAVDDMVEVKQALKWIQVVLVIELIYGTIGLFCFYPYRPNGALAWLAFLFGAPAFLVLNEWLGRLIFQNEWVDKHLWWGLRIPCGVLAALVMGAINVAIVYLLYVMAGPLDQYVVKWTS